MELTRNLKTESVSRLSPTHPHQIESTASIAAAVELMRSLRVGCLLVVRAGKLVGIFTERDLLMRVFAPNRALSGVVESVMTPDPVTVESTDPIRTAVKRMQAGNYRHLPVVDAELRPMGILSAKRIVHWLVEHYAPIVYNQPPDPNQVPSTAEGA
jgi:CBS domain-containing protein